MPRLTSIWPFCKISRQLWIFLTVIKWLLTAAALITDVVWWPKPQIYASIIGMIVLFGHLALECNFGLHWRHVEEIKKQHGVRWLRRLSFILWLMVLLSALALPLWKGELLKLPRETALLIIHSFIVTIVAWWISHMIVADVALSRWFKEQDKHR